jgi:hypothetical protein
LAIRRIVGLQWMLEPAMAEKDKFSFMYFTLDISPKLRLKVHSSVAFGDLLELQVEQIAQLLLKPGVCCCHLAALLTFGDDGFKILMAVALWHIESNCG